MVNSQHKRVKNYFPDISFMPRITDLFGSNRNVLVRDPYHSRIWLRTSPWMTGYNWLARRGPCTRLWCGRTALSWSQWVSGFPCVMLHQHAFLFLFLAAQIDGPWWSVMILICTSISSAKGGCSHWARRSFLCSHLPNERLRWAPLSYGSWSCTFLVLQGPRCPISLPDVSPCLAHRVLFHQARGDLQAGAKRRAVAIGRFPGRVIRWVSHYQAKKEASGNQVPEGWLRGRDPWSVSQ